MACSLSGKSDPESGWSTIFQKSKDSWNNVFVAVKLNCQELLQVPNAEIVEKICLELWNLGVSFSNITLYDDCGGAGGVYDKFIREPYMKSGSEAVQVRTDKCVAEKSKRLLDKTML